MQAYGYRFGMSSNRLLTTVQDSKDEASLLVKLSKQYSQQSRFLMGARLRLQVGDTFTGTYGSAGNDTVYQPSTSYIVTAVSLSISENALTGQYQLRSA
jgi:hypothetical protein